MYDKLSNLDRVLNYLGINKDIKPKTKIAYLNYLKEECEKHILKLKNKHLLELNKKANKSGDIEITWLSEAMLHARLGIKPKTQKLGYNLADMSKRYRNLEIARSFPEKLVKESKKTLAQVELICQIMREFDFVNYVFAQTHYDNCDNGIFWRRS